VLRGAGPGVARGERVPQAFWLCSFLSGKQPAVRLRPGAPPGRPGLSAAAWGWRFWSAVPGNKLKSTKTN